MSEHPHQFSANSVPYGGASTGVGYTNPLPEPIRLRLGQWATMLCPRSQTKAHGPVGESGDDRRNPCDVGHAMLKGCAPALLLLAAQRLSNTIHYILMQQPQLAAMNPGVKVDNHAMHQHAIISPTVTTSTCNMLHSSGLLAAFCETQAAQCSEVDSTGWRPAASEAHCTRDNLFLS
jgi:hypothetical protein